MSVMSHSQTKSPQHSVANDALKLSTQDVERLLTEETGDIRIDVLNKVAKAHSAQQYSFTELSIAEQILRVLVKDTEVTVREALALALKDNPAIPRDIVLALSRDVDDIALIIVEHSPVLTDSDLIALIQSARSGGKPSAVAKRKNLSAEVSDALVKTHNPHVVSTLMKNQSASISDDSYQEVLRQHSQNPDVMTSMAQRANLPITIVEKVIALVSDTLGETLRSHYRISPATVMAETEKTREIATLKLVDGHINPRDIEKLVDQLQVFGRLSPSIILTSLCRGNLYFFETSLARLSSIPTRNAQLLIHDKGGLGFKALYSKAGLPEKFFSACKLLLEVVADMHRAGDKNSGSQTYSNTVVQKLLARANGKNVENLSYIIALIRQAS
jgi:uncharacterized protein (DUF2336 family)